MKKDKSQYTQNRMLSTTSSDKFLIKHLYLDCGPTKDEGQEYDHSLAVHLQSISFRD